MGRCSVFGSLPDCPSAWGAKFDAAYLGRLVYLRQATPVFSIFRYGSCLEFCLVAIGSVVFLEPNLVDHRFGNMEESLTEVLGPDSRTVVAVFDGPAVARGRVPVADFVKVLDGFQRTLILVGQELMGRRPTRGPVPLTYTDQLTLELVSTEAGSFKATLALAERPAGQLVDIGEDALERVIDGIDMEVHGGDSNPFISEPARAVVRETILKAVGQDTRLTLHGGRRHRIIVISDKEVSNLTKTSSKTYPRGTTRLVGRLLEVDFKDRTAEVYDASGTMTRIRFSDDLAESIKAASRMQIVAEGEVEVDDQGKTRSFELRDLTTVDIADEFWNNPSLDDLVRQQGVHPIASLKDFAGPSFDQKETDDLLAELRNLRL